MILFFLCVYVEFLIFSYMILLLYPFPFSLQVNDQILGKYWKSFSFVLVISGFFFPLKVSYSSSTYWPKIIITSPG